MKKLILALALLPLSTCGGGSADNVECAIETEDSYFCVEEKSFLCPAGNAADAKVNEDIDAACMASAGNDIDALAKCSLDAAKAGKYKMQPARMAEDCAAVGKTCDWTTGSCEDKK